jgi:hypothetical protein
VQARSDGKQAIAGIGLAAQASTDVAQSEMVFLADKFTFVPSESDIDTIPQPLLFMGLVNGVNTLVVPPSRLGDQLIESRMVVDGLIEARHLNVSSVGVNLDPGFVLGQAGWTTFTGRYVGAAQTYPSPVGYYAAFSGRDGTMTPQRYIPTHPNEAFRVRCWVYREAAMDHGIVAYWMDVDGAISPFVVNVGTSPVGWVQIDTIVQAPSTAVRVSFAPWNQQAFGGLAVGYFADLIIERAVDSALVVVGGISADRIDTRGLTVKDAAGNVILSATDPLHIANITGLGALASVNGFTSSNISTYIANGAITNALIGNVIQSSSFVTGVSGWQIDKAGTAEFNDITARGNITAKTIQADNITQGIFRDPNQPGIELQATGSGVYNWDGGGFHNVHTPVTCTDGSGTSYDCGFDTPVADYMTNAAVKFTTSNAGWPIERRLKTGLVRFQVIASCSVDTFCSLWYRRNGGPWVFINTTNDTGSGYGVNVNQAVFALTMTVSETVEFAVTATNSSLAFGDIGHPNFGNGNSIAVITTNY